MARARRLAATGLCLGAAALGTCVALADRLSARDLSLELARRLGPSDEVWTYGTYLHGIPFYLGRPVARVINWVGELHYAQRDPAHASRFGDDDEIRALPLKGRRVFVVLRRWEAGYFLTLAGPGEVRWQAEFGPWMVVEF